MFVFYMFSYVVVRIHSLLFVNNFNIKGQITDE